MSKTLFEISGNKFITFAFRLVLGLVFIYASVGKILDPASFADTIYNYQILPDSLVAVSAIIVPWFEFWCAILLISGIFTRTSSALISLMLVFFIVALISVIARGLNIDCGCFSDSSAVSWSRVLEDLALLLLSLHVFFRFEGSFSLESKFFNPQD